MTGRNSQLIPAPPSNSVEPVTRSNPRITRGLTRLSSVLAHTPQVGRLLHVLGAYVLSGGTDDTAGSGAWLSASDVSVRPDGLGYLVYPYIFDENGDWVDYLADACEPSVSDFPLDSAQHIGIGNRWIILVAGVLDYGSPCFPAFDYVGYRILSSDLYADEPFFLLGQEISYTGTVPNSVLSIDDSDFICLLSEGVFLIGGVDRQIQLGSTWETYRRGAVVGDFVYAVPESNPRSIHRISLDRLVYEARCSSLADLTRSDGLIEDDIYYMDGYVLDIARQGDLLLTLESEREPNPQWATATHSNPDDQANRFRIAAYRNGTLIGAFVPHANGRPLAPASLDACDTKIIVGVPAHQGGAVVFEGGTLSDWRLLDPVPWRHPDDDVLATVVAGWDSIRRIAKLTDVKTAALLASSVPTRVCGPDLLVEALYPFHARMLNKAKQRAVVEYAVQEVTGCQLTLWTQVRGGESTWPAHVGSEPLTIDLIEQNWQAILEEVEATDARVAKWLASASWVRVSDRRISIEIPGYVDWWPVGLGIVAQAVLRVTNARVRVSMFAPADLDLIPF